MPTSPTAKDLAAQLAIKHRETLVAAKTAVDNVLKELNALNDELPEYGPQSPTKNMLVRLTDSLRGFSNNEIPGLIAQFQPIPTEDAAE